MKHPLAALLTIGSMAAIARPQGINDIRGINAQGDLYAISVADGSGHLLGSSGLSDISAMACRPDWQLYVSTWNGGSTSKLYKIGRFNGQATFVTDVNLGNIRALAFTAPNQLHAVNDPSPTNGPDDLYTIDLASGSATLVGPIGFSGVEELALTFNGLYGWDIGDGVGAGLIKIDLGTGAGNDVNPGVGGGNDVQTLAYSSWHKQLYGGFDKLYVVNETTGEAHLVGDGDYSDLRGLDAISLDYFFMCVSKPTSLGCAPGLSTYSLTVSKSGAPAAPIVAGTVPGGTLLPGILLYSTAILAQPVQTTFGKLCLSAFKRAGAFPASPGGDEGVCNGHYSWDLAAIVASSSTIAVGDHLMFQAWYRDSGFPPPGNANFTNELGWITVVP